MKKSNTDQYYQNALNSLSELLSINSIYDETTVTKNKPFGAGVAKALEYIASLGEKLGYTVSRCDGYVTELSIGEGKILDIYAHTDVVPVGTGWSNEAFTPTIRAGKLYARGAIDDKGPLMACLYAIECLRHKKKLNGFKVRLIVGGDEERGSRCLKYYFETLKKEYPTFGFTPDGEFPLIYAEKAIGTFEITYKIKIKVPPFNVGVATNVVPDCASVTLDVKQDEVQAYQKKYGVVIKQDGPKLTFIGKAAHGSTPWNGTNAGLHLLNFIGTHFADERLTQIYDYYFDGRGNKFEGNYPSKYFDGSSYNVGLIKFDGEILKLSVNVRYPENVIPKDAGEQVQINTHAGELRILSFSKCVVFDPNLTLVKLLKQVYQETTGDSTSRILAIGGGTYARESKNTIAFGPSRVGYDYGMHDKDEHIPLHEFSQLIYIYANAIEKLGEELVK